MILSGVWFFVLFNNNVLRGVEGLLFMWVEPGVVLSGAWISIHRTSCAVWCLRGLALWRSRPLYIGNRSGTSLSKFLSKENEKEG